MIYLHSARSMEFLDLPQEVRRRVYQFYLTSDRALPSTCIARKPLRLQGLWYACKQIREDTRPAAHAWAIQWNIIHFPDAWSVHQLRNTPWYT